jgi:glutamate-1-semialdehyde 2,1-aminomutase
MDGILTARGIAHSFAGHPSMSGLFFNQEPPTNYREWCDSDYEFYDALAQELHELGILVEPDSREPWFLCEAHDVKCIDETLDKFEKAVDITMRKSPEEHSKIATSFFQ